MCKADSKPCEKCGYCPACGRGPQQVWPNYAPYWYWPNTSTPFKVGDFPSYINVTCGGTYQVAT